MTRRISLSLFTCWLFFISIGSSYAADIEDAKQKLAEGKAVLVDVREEGETKGGIIEGAIWIATSEIKGDTDVFKKVFAALPTDKLIYTYCASGFRSGSFTKSLAAKGFKSSNLGGYKSLVAGGMKPTRH